MKRFPYTIKEEVLQEMFILHRGKITFLFIWILIGLTDYLILGKIFDAINDFIMIWSGICLGIVLYVRVEEEQENRDEE